MGKVGIRHPCDQGTPYQEKSGPVVRLPINYYITYSSDSVTPVWDKSEKQCVTILTSFERNDLVRGKQSLYRYMLLYISV